MSCRREWLRVLSCMVCASSSLVGGLRAIAAGDVIVGALTYPATKAALTFFHGYLLYSKSVASGIGGVAAVHGGTGGTAAAASTTTGGTGMEMATSTSIAVSPTYQPMYQPDGTTTTGYATQPMPATNVYVDPSATNAYAAQQQ